MKKKVINLLVLPINFFYLLNVHVTPKNINFFGELIKHLKRTGLKYFKKIKIKISNI